MSYSAFFNFALPQARDLGALLFRLRPSRLSPVAAEVTFSSHAQAAAFARSNPRAFVRRAAPLRSFFVVVVPLQVGSNPLAGNPAAGAWSRP